MRLLSSAVLLFLTVSSLAQPDHAAKLREFEAFAERELKAQQMTAISVAVKYGDFTWARGFGLADLENNVAATPDSSYRMASVTKPMTAVAVLKLVEEGKVDLDAEVQKYVPSFPRKAHPVTIRQLLAHQGGISHYRDYMKEGRIREPMTTAQALAVFADFDLVNEPGTAFHYTSYGFNLLGAVIEGASGKPYGEYLTENVWKPLGMTATRMDDPRAIIPHRAHGYTLEEGKLRRSEYVDISSRFGGGGTRSTVLDMVRFIDGLAAGKVLTRESLDRAWTMAPTRDGRYTRYGLGFGVYPRNGRYVVAHSGSQQEARTNLTYIPDARLTIALASNFEDAELDVFEEKLIELLLGDPKPFGLRGSTVEDDRVLGAIQSVYSSGLAYYSRHGRAMTTDPRTLEEAFRYFRTSLADQKKVDDGRQPLTGEPYTKIGSYMASVLAANGKSLSVYHRDGALRFLADYAQIPGKPKLDAAFSRRVTAWLRDWERVWTPELRGIDLKSPASLALLEPLAAASVKPDYAGELVYHTEQAAMRGDVATAVRMAGVGLAAYPQSPALNGVSGVLALLGGDRPRAVTLLRRSVELDPKGYASPRNLVNISRSVPKAAAVALLELGLELHGANEALNVRLAELR